MITLDKALEILAATVKPGRTETVPVLEAVGRVVAHDLTSDIDVAPFDDSAMDGFAIISADLAQASQERPVVLECVGSIGAGSCYEARLQAGQCVRIMTGAPVPEGADSVVKVEITTCEGDGGVGDRIGFSAPSAAGRNIRKAGEEAKAGEVVMHAGEVVTPAGAGLLSATGTMQVPVYARPKVGFIGIGSELVDATEIPGPGMIRDSARWSVAASIQDAGGVVELYPRVADDADAIEAAFRQAIAECDMVVSTGGACMGDFDLTPGILAKLGTIHFSRVSLKPGKSQPFGTVDGKPVFVLSGNPAASAVGCELYVRRALRIMQGYSELERPCLMARITEDIKKKDPRLIMQRGCVRRADDGSFTVETVGNQSSGLFGSLQRSNCLFFVPEGTEGLRCGDQVKCLLTRVSEGAF